MNRFFVLLILIALALSGCKLIFMNEEPVSKTTLTAEDNGSTATLEVGTRLYVELTGNPSTGYEWELAGVDEAVLTPLGEPDYEAKDNLPGGGGLYSFRFEAVAAGETRLKLVYHRPWENVEPHETFEITVIIQSE